MHTAKWMITIAVGLGLGTACRADQGEGLTPSADSLTWSRWQARISLGTSAPLWGSALGSRDNPGLKVHSVRLMGDYYFSVPQPLSAELSAGGFRATGGLLHGSRSTSWAGLAGFSSPGTMFSVGRRLFGHSGVAAWIADSAEESTTLPYLGIGYSGLSVRGGWSFNADLGLVAQAPGQAIKLGRVISGTQGLDELLRDLRLAPVLQLGVSYSF